MRSVQHAYEPFGKKGAIKKKKETGKELVLLTLKRVLKSYPPHRDLSRQGYSVMQNYFA